MDNHLQELERKSIAIIREANAKFKKIGIMWSMGKDSTTLLFLCKKAFFGRIPFPAIYLDNGHDFPETYQFRDKIVSEWNLDLIVGRAEFKKDEVSGTVDGLSKVEALKKIVNEHGFEALMVPIRRDSHKARAGEGYFSPRDDNFQWNPKINLPKTFDSISDFKGASHVRVHPSLDWTELDIWRYIKENDIPAHPLYFAKDGKRYRSLGYPGATFPVESGAETVEAIIQELQTTEVPERSGRAAEKEKDDVMRRLRELGYM